ncbi:hypothetical protein NP493_986g00054 [Ridgeia piscesae]|uniref:Uncharacterized protein n=1 Tax=Ridgeia piscesae TaxID=27915 RepID=A0AAD9KKG3_RIDPI|nr:hypothetical protein NP493_986g00054 [Ridgeia piscesae]
MPHIEPYRKLGLIRHLREHVAQNRDTARRVHEIKSLLRANVRLDKFPIRHNVLRSNTPVVTSTGSACVFLRIPCRVSSTMRLRGDDKTLVIDAHAPIQKGVPMYCDVLGPSACRECTRLYRRRQFETDINQAHPALEVNQRTMHARRSLALSVRLPSLPSSTITTTTRHPNRKGRPRKSRSGERTRSPAKAKPPTPVRPILVTDNEIHARVIEKQRHLAAIAPSEVAPLPPPVAPPPVSPKRASAGSRRVSSSGEIHIPMVSSRESSFLSRAMSNESHWSVDGARVPATD